ncbi:hypothetical protein KGF56_003602 [Candida oxycetoniae]|uniref:Uncharacterized protein n=1 Tax=Candida oxycetoniae TaxID=497107 RepID=A0AAI9SV79_9ASCO|nr:uncharacterized protein KGF56_003602 [Candida oxycetoniae]KAI3403557.2 hypothetical protein KGF56_003602 [Candida oxycetoniae]
MLSTLQLSNPFDSKYRKMYSSLRAKSFPSSSLISNHNQQQHHKHLISIYHEIYIMLCLLDDLFKYDILDIETISKCHEYLKNEFRYKKLNHHSTRINYHIRKYLEFLRVINPMDDTTATSTTTITTISSVTSATAALKAKAVFEDEETECWFINDEIPRVVKMYIKSTISIFERYLDLMIFDNCAISDYCSNGSGGVNGDCVMSLNYNSDGGSCSDEGDISCYMV